MALGLLGAPVELHLSVNGPSCSCCVVSMVAAGCERYAMGVRLVVMMIGVVVVQGQGGPSVTINTDDRPPATVRTTVPRTLTAQREGDRLAHQLLEWKGNPKMCLSSPVKPGVFSVGLAPCNATSKEQQWTQNLASQFVVNVADNQCLNAVQTGGVTLVACTPGLMDVQWTYSKTGELVSGSTSFCLTVKGTSVTQATCSATAKADLWTWKNVTA